MDNNQNQEGLDGLPLEPWMNRQHLSSVHPGLSAQAFSQHMGAQPLHDLLSHRSLQTFSTDNSKTLSSSPSLQQYSLSSSARLNQPEHLSLSHERSAWSQLLALDPTKITQMGSHLPNSQVHCLTQDTQLAQSTRHDPVLMLKGDPKLTPFDNRSLNLPKLNFALASNSAASIPHDNYLTVKSPQNKMLQQFNQPMNFSKAAYASKPTPPQTLAISADVSSLESSGSYSPVSPPAVGANLDEPNISSSGQSSSRTTDLFLRESHDMSSATFPLFSASDQADFFNYLSGKDDAFPSDINMQDSYSESAKSFTGLFSSEVPLDMTTAFNSKDTVPEVAFSSDSITNGKSSLTETLFTKDCVHPKDSVSEMNATASTADRNQSQIILPNACDEKITRLVKSTPKKSNFYGRDASLFSFMPSSSYMGDAPVSEYQSSDLVRADVIENKDVVTSNNEAFSESFGIQSLDKVSNAAESNTVTSGVSTVSITTLSRDEHAVLPPDPVTNVSADCSNLQILEDCNTSEAWNNDTLGKSFDSKETLVAKTSDIQSNDYSEDNDLTQDEVKDLSSSNDDTVIGDADNTEKELSEESTDTWSQNVDIQEHATEDFLTARLISKPKTAKRKKRKAATGFQTRQRKKPVKKQRLSNLAEGCDGGLNTEVNNSNTDPDAQDPDVSELQNDEQTSYLNETTSVKRKPRRVSTAKASNVDLTPRRSSSRKSKDNAMRLIELQADSNYSGIAESAPVVEKKATRKRKNTKLSSSLVAGGGFSEGDTTEEEKSDENDGDYVYDEDEIEGFDNDEPLEHPVGKKIKEKKLGSLKISIKLSGNSSAEIVSGIDDSPATKKRKTAKKKNQKTKNKNKMKPIKESDEEEAVQEPLNSSGAVENCEETVNAASDDRAEDAGNSSDAKDRHMSLMEKYFLTASTATAARQTQKKTGRESAAQRKTGAKVKVAKNLALKSGKKQNEQSKELLQKTPVKSGGESAVQNNKAEKGVTHDDAETGVAKFICGYCPQRYHNKQELLAHMEAHMVEMEKTSDTEVGEDKKTQSVTTNLTASRDPRSNRSGNAEIISTKPSVAEKTAEKVKLKPVGDLVKESKDSNVKSVQETLKQKLKCGECGEVFDSKPNLLEHVRIHTADKPFECDICHKCFTERNLLSVHRKTHGQEKLLRCHMCSKAFVDKTDLNLHMQSHPRRSNAKPADKHVLIIKKSLKKSLQDKQDLEDPFVPKKPKSFALALTGEMDVPGKATDTSSSVLVITRGEGTSAEAKNSSSSGSHKPILIEPKVSLKPLTSNIKPAIVKTISYTKKPVEISVANSNVKGDSNKIDGKKSNDVTASSDGEKTEAVVPNVCTCKECPDCVTRFLQSFE
ncbi:unnamed protein product [Candidula unifasciata]|uniref:C2H2-type domain-containing protein n=1 Tax=Candidula unifasciata TaxID=100452 RepID=A0A8S3ZKL3_9EUPU|nr:unnamed protein product [Candidula unifasciata]